MILTSKIATDICSGAHLVVSVSGGKDSDCMAKVLYKLWKDSGRVGEFILIHADVKGFEWPQSEERCWQMANELNVSLVIVSHHSGEKFVDAGIRGRMRSRPDSPPFPSSACRWCTSNWKRGPISKWIRNQYPRDAIVYAAIGIRAEESPARAKKDPLTIRKTAVAPTKNREVYDWYPIFRYSLGDVWQTLLPDGGIDLLHWYQNKYQEEGVVYETYPYHPAYVYGNNRVSCACCVLADANDLGIGIEHNPDIYRDILVLEDESGFTFTAKKSIKKFRQDRI